MVGVSSSSASPSVASSSSASNTKKDGMDDAGGGISNKPYSLLRLVWRFLLFVVVGLLLLHPSLFIYNWPLMMHIDESSGSWLGWEVLARIKPDTVVHYWFQPQFPHLLAKNPVTGGYLLNEPLRFRESYGASPASGSTPTTLYVLTGASGGIGFAAAKRLETLVGVESVVLGARSPEKLAAEWRRGRPEEESEDARSNDRIVGIPTILPLDLASLDSVQAFAREITEIAAARRVGSTTSQQDEDDQKQAPSAAPTREEREEVDIVLIHNAGLGFQKHKSLTGDGFEAQFQINHLGPYLLTRLLTKRLRRVVHVSSMIHAVGRIHSVARARSVARSVAARPRVAASPAPKTTPDLPQAAQALATHFRPYLSYFDSKLLQIVTSHGWNRRQKKNSGPGDEFDSVAVHPGLVDTKLSDELYGLRISMSSRTVGNSLLVEQVGQSLGGKRSARSMRNGNCCDRQLVVMWERMQRALGGDGSCKELSWGTDGAMSYGGLMQRVFGPGRQERVGESPPILSTLLIAKLRKLFSGFPTALRLLRSMGRFAGCSPEEAAESILFAAFAPLPAAGYNYVADGQWTQSAGRAHDPVLQDFVLAASELLVEPWLRG